MEHTQHDAIDTPKESGIPAFFRPVKTYVLRAGRMTAAQKNAYAVYRSKWCIPFSAAMQPLHLMFGNDRPVTVEIGFGMGKATAIIAGQNPDNNYLGLEVHTPGVARLLRSIEDENLVNLRIIEHDALEVLEQMIPDNSVAAFHVFFPDPWPKKKHHKRRLMQRPRTDLLARKLIPGGYIAMATDWEPYAESALEELTSTPGLVNKYGGYAPRQTWRPETRFEEKGISARHRICELVFVKSNPENGGQTV